MDLRFKVDGGVTFWVAPVDSSEAADVGCPDATHKTIGPRTGLITYGRLDITGKETRRGRRAHFTPTGLDPVLALPGYVLTD